MTFILKCFPFAASTPIGEWLIYTHLKPNSRMKWNTQLWGRENLYNQTAYWVRCLDIYDSVCIYIYSNGAEYVPW